MAQYKRGMDTIRSRRRTHGERAVLELSPRRFVGVAVTRGQEVFAYVRREVAPVIVSARKG
jgi:hypothetical protein